MILADAQDEVKVSITYYYFSNSCNSRCKEQNKCRCTLMPYMTVIVPLFSWPQLHPHPLLLLHLLNYLNAFALDVFSAFTRAFLCAIFWQMRCSKRQGVAKLLVCAPELFSGFAVLCAVSTSLCVCVFECEYHMRLNVHKILLRSLQAALASATERERESANPRPRNHNPLRHTPIPISWDTFQVRSKSEKQCAICQDFV